MKDRIIRVELDAANVTVPAYHHDNAVPGGLPDRPSAPQAAEAASPSDTVRPAIPDLRLNFSFRQMVMPGWSGASAYPCTRIDFNFPEADQNRVMAWFSGNYKGVNNPASATLLNNASAAVKGALKSCVDTADGLDYFTSPFRVGWAFRLRDGSRRMTQPTELLKPNRRSPLAAILSHTVATGSLSTLSAITLMPSRLLFNTSPAVTEETDWGDVTHIDIIAAPQADVIPRDLNVTGVTTVVEDDVRYRCFAYARLSAEEVENSASIQNDFRILCSIPVEEMPGAYPRAVPVTPGALSDWKLLPGYSPGAADDGSDNDAGDDGADDDGIPWEPWIDKETVPLDLGMPEERKWVRSVWVRGRYDRSGLRVRVYGSRHRQSWTEIGDGVRGWVDGLATAGFRWFKVRITGDMRRGDRIDAVTFRVTRCRKWR